SDLQKRYDPFHVPQVVCGGLPLDLPIDGVLEQDGANDALTGDGRAGDDARPHLMHDREHLLRVGPRIVLDAVSSQRVGRAAAALIQGGNEPAMGSHLLQLFLEVAHSITSSRGVLARLTRWGMEAASSAAAHPGAVSDPAAAFSVLEQERGDQGGPSRLMARAESRAGVAIEVLV